ncbi:unnamed protein product [Toxocara canis]|uniref:Nanos-type domain-containing protein n=1 Tax=Toxocara canis TaxID=6265 RepID=A0A183UHD0_TOXCA|nr:unnamed protein product [Toxocara canis]
MNLSGPPKNSSQGSIRAGPDYLLTKNFCYGDSDRDGGVFPGCRLMLEVRSLLQILYANMPQPVMLPGGQYYVVQPVPQFQKNGVTYYGAAAIEKQRTHLFVDSIREQYLSMNNPVRNEPDVYTASVVNPSNSSTQNGLLELAAPNPLKDRGVSSLSVVYLQVEQPYVKGTIMQSSVTPSQSAVIAQQPNVQIAVQQPLVNYQSCYSFPSNYDRSTPQQVQFFCSQPSTPSPSAGDQTRFSFVAVNTNEQCEGAVPSRAYSQPTLACVPSASLPASKASVPVLHSVTSLNCSQNPTAVVPGYKPQLTSSNETVAGAQDMTYVQSGGFTMSRPQSSVGVLPAASVPATPTPYQPVAPTPYEPQQCGQTQSAQLPGSVVMEDGRVVYLQPQPLRPEAPFFPAPGQPFLQGPVVAAPSQIAQPFGGSGIPSQQFVQQGQACVARREPQRPRVFISPLRLPTVRIAPNPRVAEMAKRPNLVSLTATPPSYNPSNVNRNRKKPAVVLPYTGFKRKEEKEESEDENTSRNVTAQKRWGEPPQTINVPKVESVDKSEKEDTGAHSVDNTNLTTKGEGATNATGSTNGDVHFVREHSVEHDQCGVKREEDRAEADKASAEKTATNENGDKSAANSQESKSHAGAKCGGDIATPRTLTVSNNEDYADEGSSPRSAMRVGSHLSTAMECAYCRSKKEPPEVYRSHSLRNTRTGITTCPKLRQQVCALCNATGDQAHTPYFCPLNRNRGAGTRSSNGVGAPMRALQSGGRPSWPQRRGGGVSLQAKSDLRAYADALAGSCELQFMCGRISLRM